MANLLLMTCGLIYICVGCTVFLYGLGYITPKLGLLRGFFVSVFTGLFWLPAVIVIAGFNAFQESEEE